MSVSYNLYLASFCARSQRISMALYEAGVPVGCVTSIVKGQKIPGWILQMTPKGILPVLHHKEKDTENVVVGYDEIIQYLDRNPKFQKFTLPKKKRYQHAMQHCKEKFEPILDQLVEDAPNVISGALCKALLHELEWINNNIQGPFYCGNNFTWVDIFYLSYLERIPLVKHLYKFQIPSSLTNLLSWLDRLKKKDSFALSKFAEPDLLGWFEAIIKTNTRESTLLPVQYNFMVNSTLLAGISDLVLLLHQVQESNFAMEKLQEFCLEFSKFDLVHSEHSRCKIFVLYKSFAEKQESIANDFPELVKNQQEQILTIHEALKQLIEIVNLHSLQQAVQNNDSEQAKKNLHIIHWKLKDAPEPKKLVSDLSQDLENFSISLRKDFEKEKQVFGAILPNKEANGTSLDHEPGTFRQLSFLVPYSSFGKFLTWIINRIDTPQDRELIMFTFRSVMPFRFSPELISNFKESLREDYSIELAPIFKEPANPPNPTKPDAVPGIVGVLEEFTANSTKSDRSMSPVEHHEEKPTRKPRSRILSKFGQAPSSKRPSGTDVVKGSPALILEFMNQVVIRKLDFLESLIRVRPINMSLLEEALQVFIVAIIHDLQTDTVIFPNLCRLYPGLQPTVESFALDHQQLLGFVNDILLIFAKARTEPYGSPACEEALGKLVEQLFSSILLVKQLSRKQTRVVVALLNQYFPVFKDQAVVMRELFDVSPVLFPFRIIPWIFRELSPTDQDQFVESLSVILGGEHGQLFDQLLNLLKSK